MKTFSMPLRLAVGNESKTIIPFNDRRLGGERICRF
jgi:hypothetical protein